MISPLVGAVRGVLEHLVQLGAARARKWASRLLTVTSRLDGPRRQRSVTDRHPCTRRSSHAGRAHTALVVVGLGSA